MDCKENKAAGVLVSIEMLSDEALNGLIQEFILREGTDYGTSEHTFLVTLWLLALEHPTCLRPFAPDQ